MARTRHARKPRRVAERAMAKPPCYRCVVCGNTEGLQHSRWVDVNTDALAEDFGSWCAGDNSWCPKCQDHTYLEEIPKSEPKSPQSPA